MHPTESPLGVLFSLSPSRVLRMPSIKISKKLDAMDIFDYF